MIFEISSVKASFKLAYLFIYFFFHLISWCRYAALSFRVPQLRWTSWEEEISCFQLFSWLSRSKKDITGNGNMACSSPPLFPLSVTLSASNACVRASHRCLGLSVCWWKQSSVLGNAPPLFSLRHVVSPLPSPTPCGGAVRVQTQQVANCVPHDRPSQSFTSSMSSCLQTADSRRRRQVAGGLHVATTAHFNAEWKF